MKIRDLFNAAAQDYDRQRPTLVPCFDDLYGIALDLVPFAQDAPIRVLDLGAGTGLLAGMIAAAYPNAQLTLIDIAPAMLAQAQQRFKRLARPATFITADYVSAPIVGQFDLIVSALALHHTPAAQLPGVFANIYAALAAGGRFINIDQALGSTAANEARLEQTWRAQVRAKGATEPMLAAAIERMTLDRTAPLRDQLRWLNEVGFVNVECWYRHYRFCVFSGDVVKQIDICEL